MRFKKFTLAVLCSFLAPLLGSAQELDNSKTRSLFVTRQADGIEVTIKSLDKNGRFVVVDPSREFKKGDELRLEFQSNRGTTPARATPATSARHRGEDGQHCALQGRGQDGRSPGSRLPPDLFPTLALLPLTISIRPHHAINGGARTEEHGGNLSRALVGGAK